MDASYENVPYLKVKYKNKQRICSVCESTGTLFKISSDENRQKQWFSALKWNVPQDKLKYIVESAKVCDKHFDELCFTSTLRRRITKFACPRITENIQSTTTENVLPSAESACPITSDLPLTTTDLVSTASDNHSTLTEGHSHVKEAKVNEPESSCSSTNFSSPTTCFNSSGRLQVTPKTRRIRNLLSNNSKLKKRLFKIRCSSRLTGQLQAKLADKPFLFRFISSQLRMQCRSKKGRRWSTKEKSFALQIYFHSPSAYRILRKYFAFPSKATLHRYTYNVAKGPGFCPNLIKCLKTQSSRMAEAEKLCILTLDEMSIKPGYSYATDIDCVDGFTSFKQDCEDKAPYATQALVFMARGGIKNWKQVLGYYFTSPTDKFSLKKLVLEAIDILHSCEMEVVSIVCDQGPKNQGLFTALKVTKENPFFIHKTKNIYAMYDPPHLLKSTRNNLKNYGISYEDSSIGNTTRQAFANWKHIEEMYEMDSKDEFSACRKLTKKHVYVSGLKKMNVKLAAQVLSHSVASALSLYVAAQRIESSAIDTARFIKKMDSLFDTVNSRTMKHQKKELCAVSKNSCHIKIWEEMVSWIKTWKIVSKEGKEIFAPSKNGWILTLNAFIRISQDLLEKNKFILTNRFSQDVVENTFATIRRRGGFRDNPDTSEFRHTIHKVIIANFLKHSNSKNCKDDEAYTLIDFSTFNKKEIFDILDSEDSYHDDTDVDQRAEHAVPRAQDAELLTLNSVNVLDDDISLTEESAQKDNSYLLSSVSENVLSYVSGYFAKKYLSSDTCSSCQKLLVDDAKLLDNHNIFFRF